MRQPTRIDREVFADYNVFFLLTDSVEARTGTDWIEEVASTMIAARPSVVYVGSVRRTSVPVSVELRTDAPADDHLADSDHIVEAGLTTLTGAICLVGWWEEWESKPAGEPTPIMTVEPGTYRVRVYFTGFDTLDEYLLEGDDHYMIVLWPAEAESARVIKRYSGKIPGGLLTRVCNSVVRQPWRS